MKIAVEFRSFMSIAEAFRALTICHEAAGRLAHRMSEADLDRLDRAALALAEISGAERARRQPAFPRVQIVHAVTAEVCTPCTEDSC